jgi:class 3 adenylate cyclase/sensor domain CHASE-containing protein
MSSTISFSLPVDGLADSEKSNSGMNHGGSSSVAGISLMSEGNASRGSMAFSLKSSGSMFFSWGRMASKADYWTSASDDGMFNEQKPLLRLQQSLSDGTKTCATSIRLTFLTAVSTPSIIITTLLTLIALLTITLITVHALADAHSSELRVRAVDTAEELGGWISNQLDEALLPLFAMSQFVKHLEDFKQLPYQIGPRGLEGSAPPLVGKETSHRNVTGICDDPHTQQLFHDIAANIKKDAGLEGILVNIQLAPQSVVCMLHPLVNTEDFAEGIVMNNTGAVGHDLLNDPNRVAIARATVPSPDVVIAGPLNLIQGGTSVVKEAFIARLAINMEGYKITVDGVDYPCWGFAVILLNWAALKEKAGIDQRFTRVGMEYRLTRTDWKTNTTTGELYSKVATIAESARSTVLHPHNSVSVDLDTTNNLWVMTVGYEDGFAAPWINWLTGLVVALSVLVSVLLLTVLVANKQKKTLLYKMMPPNVIRKLQRGETVVEKYDLSTIFFSDVVGFTKLSAELKPIDVMEMLNEMYSAFDALVEKHKLYKVDTCGDAYIVIGGMKGAGNGNDFQGRTGAERVALFALDALEACKGLRAKNRALVCIRAGLASGPVVAGVVGNTMPKFTLFGDTVNFASRMESTSVKMRIQCSDTTYRLLRDAKENEFDLEERIDANGEVGVVAKGKGRVATWFINGAEPRTVTADSGRTSPETHGEEVTGDLEV